MTWTRLSDTFTDSPAMLLVTRSARLLHVEALIWCNRHLTDGAVPRAALPRVSDAEDINELVRELEDRGLWEPTGAGWQLDWSEQETAAEVRARKTYRAEKQKRYRDRKNKHGRGDHSDCDPRYCRDLRVTGNETGLVTSSRPLPARPPTGSGRGSDPAVARCDDCRQPLAADGSCGCPGVGSPMIRPVSVGAPVGADPRRSA